MTRMPARMALASEAFSGTIDYLMPHARQRYADVPLEEFAPIVDGFFRGDDTADALVARMRQDRGVRAQLDRALEHGIGTVREPLPEVAAFVATIDEPPDWIDPERAAAGVRALRRIDGVTLTGVGWVLGFLLAAILPNSARSMSANSRAVENPGRRYAETGRIGLDSFQREQHDRFSGASLSAARLRILHATVRAHLRRGGDWDEALHGVPISATDTLGASLVTCGTVLAAMRAGYRFSDRELGGISHYIALFAARMGTPADLVPRTFDDQTAAFWFLLRTARGNADPAATDRLMPALVGIELEGVPRALQPLVRSLFNGYARIIFGDELCAASGIPDSRTRHVIPLARHGIRPFEAVRSRVGPVDRVTDLGADLMWSRLMPQLLSAGTDYGADHVAEVVRS